MEDLNDDSEFTCMECCENFPDGEQYACEYCCDLCCESCIGVHEYECGRSEHEDM